MAPKLDQYGVRRSSDHQIGDGTFDRAKFEHDLHDVLFGQKAPLDRASIDGVAGRAIRLIESQISFHDLRLTPAESRARPDIVGAIPTELISGAVENVLREGQGRGHRMAELLYVMGVRGRVDYRPDGWAGAGEVLDWIQRRYTHVEIPERRRVPHAHPLLVTRTTWKPTTVLKRHHGSVPFAMHQFRQSLEAALHGRAHANGKATIVAHHVLGSLEGQHVVHSAQLAAGALIGLRRVDDVAYLRWATVVKGIESVRSFTEEASGLISHPSPRLRWQERTADS